MRIVFVNRYFHPDHSATSQLLTELAFALAAAGDEVSVVTSRQRYDDPTAALPRRERVNNVDILRVGGFRFGRGRLAGRLLDYLSFHCGARHALGGLLQQGDTLVALTDPPLLSVTCAGVARRRGARLVNWLQDLFPEVAMAVGMPLPGFLERILVRLRNGSLRGAAANVVIGEAMGERVRAAGVAPSKVSVVPNWAIGTAGSEPAEPLDGSWQMPDCFTVGYSGNLGRAHDVDTLLAGLEATVDDDLCWLFIGGGSGMNVLRARATEARWPHFRWHPYLPIAQLAAGLALPDVHLVSLLPSMEGLVSPSKLYGILAAGKPVIFVGERDGEIGRLVATTGCGFAVQSGDGTALGVAVRRLRGDPDLRTAMGLAARELHDRSLTRSGAIAAWRSLLGRAGGA